MSALDDLNIGDFSAPQRHKITRYLEALLADERELNDKPADEEDTANTRGKIEQLKDLIRVFTVEPLQRPQKPDGITSDRGAGY